MPRFTGQFCKKKKMWGREAFLLLLFSKNFIKSTTAAIVTLSRMICFISFQSKNLYSILFYVQVEDLKIFIKVWYTKKNRYGNHHEYRTKSSTTTNIIHNNQYHPLQPILKQSFRVPQLLYVKIKDRINKFYEGSHFFFFLLSMKMLCFRFICHTVRTKWVCTILYLQLIKASTLTTNVREAFWTKVSNLARNKCHAFADQR